MLHLAPFTTSKITELWGRGFEYQPWFDSRYGQSIYPPRQHESGMHLASCPIGQRALSPGKTRLVVKLPSTDPIQICKCLCIPGNIFPVGEANIQTNNVQKDYPTMTQNNYHSKNCKLHPVSSSSPAGNEFAAVTAKKNAAISCHFLRESIIYISIMEIAAAVLVINILNIQSQNRMTFLNQALITGDAWMQQENA
ncbi:uncharacterized protein LOC110827721 isoform X1 [Zootermopsis nevadensis]|uniref:uncharacterized protein LOC110827721 isoform X1 n=1 Tax=Zootermopsis nevadensis TaxID=136037 RepID=UPI000B8EB4CC|nr:uncharacterized protein LOC110827721 isoform X1 [Zootermopsis nevadensis]